MKKSTFIAAIALATLSLTAKAEQTFTHVFTAYTGHRVMLTDKPCTLGGEKFPGLFSAVVKYPTHDKPMTEPKTEHFVMGCWRVDRRKNLMNIILFNGDRLILEGKFVGVTT